MAVLKQIKFGEGAATPIAQTVVTAASESVLSVTGTNTGLDKDANPSYAVDLNISADGTLVKDTTGEQAVLKVGTVPAAQVSVDNSAAGITSTTAQAAFKELKDAIDDVDGAAKSYKIVSVANPASTSYAEYKIQQRVGESGAWGDVTDSAAIIVPKDNAFVTAQLGHVGATVDSTTGVITDGSGEDALLIEYVNGSGVYTLVSVPVGAFLKESEFKDGLAVSANGEVSAKLGNGLAFGNEATGNKSINVQIDSTSESFLTVGAGGVKLAGVQDAIDAKVAALDKTDDAAIAGQYVAAIEETDGVVAVKTRANVSEAVLNNYSKGNDATAVAATDTVNEAISKLENQVDAAEAAATSGITTAIEALNFTDTAVAGQYVSEVDETNGVISVQRANVSDAVLTGYTKGNAPAAGSEAVAATDDVKGAIAKLEHQVDAAKAAASAAHSKVVQATNTGNEHVTVTASQPDASGAVTYTIGESDIASAQALADEISRAQSAETAIDSAVGLTKAASGETRTWSPTTNYGGTTTSVKDNMQALDTQLKTVSDKLAAIQYKVTGTTLEFYGMTLHD